MRLSEYIIDVGKMIAFYPGLRRVTNSLTASVLLCQLIYWCDKTKDKDGWIYKTNYDLEEETSLTIYEQQTARKVLVDLKILEEEFKRLDHTMRYRLNLDRLNDLWDQTSGKYERPTVVGEQPVLSLKDFQNPELHKNDPVLPLLPPRTDAKKKGDLVDGFLHFNTNEGAKREEIKNNMHNQIENLLHINTGNPKWDKFIDYAYIRQEKFNEPIGKWILWAIKNNFSPIYWTPEKCQTTYPQAFVEDTVNKPREDFVEKQPVQIEEHYDPMPEKAKPKRKLY
jgi:hypothetical protein